MDASGDELLAPPFNLGGGAPPITYTVDATQFVGFATATQFMPLMVGGNAKMPEAPVDGGFRKGKGTPKARPASGMAGSRLRVSLDTIRIIAERTDLDPRKIGAQLRNTKPIL